MAFIQYKKPLSRRNGSSAVPGLRISQRGVVLAGPTVFGALGFKPDCRYDLWVDVEAGLLGIEPRDEGTYQIGNCSKREARLFPVKQMLLDNGFPIVNGARLELQPERGTTPPRFRFSLKGLKVVPVAELPKDEAVPAAAKVVVAPIVPPAAKESPAVEKIPAPEPVSMTIDTFPDCPREGGVSFTGLGYEPTQVELYQAISKAGDLPDSLRKQPAARIVRCLEVFSNGKSTIAMEFGSVYVENASWSWLRRHDKNISGIGEGYRAKYCRLVGEFVDWRKSGGKK